MIKHFNIHLRTGLECCICFSRYLQCLPFASFVLLGSAVHLGTASKIIEITLVFRCGMKYCLSMSSLGPTFSIPMQPMYRLYYIVPQSWHVKPRSGCVKRHSSSPNVNSTISANIIDAVSLPRHTYTCRVKPHPLSCWQLDFEEAGPVGSSGAWILVNNSPVECVA